MSAAWDSSPALSPVPWGERSREAFNCVPGDQQSAPLINSFGVRDGDEPVDHRGEGSRRVTNDACRRRLANRSRERPASAWWRASAGLLIAGARSQAGAASSTGRANTRTTWWHTERPKPNALAEHACRRLPQASASAQDQHADVVRTQTASNENSINQRRWGRDSPLRRIRPWRSGPSCDHPQATPPRARASATPLRAGGHRARRRPAAEAGPARR